MELLSVGLRSVYMLDTDCMIFTCI